ncbi:Serpin (serine protease inhibitor) [compost metagenome]
MNTINNWVSQQTNNKIPSIIDKINSEMVMYLMNAVYFKGDWKYPFDKSNTAPAKFNIDATHQVDADFMHVQKASINSFVNSTVSVHELPYGNEKYSMVIVMPRQPEVALNDLINDLDANKWQAWMNGLNTHNAYFIMPKFKFSYTITLNNALSNLGMGIALSRAADFTKINADGGLNISEVKQKTFIEVDEKGTEAAAVTSVGIEVTSMPAPLHVDRPFLFAIREMKTGLILFTGAVHNPNFN